jgi:regulator of protease activity HflC (stomatin/prohibitin superfamily)
MLERLRAHDAAPARGGAFSTPPEWFLRFLHQKHAKKMLGVAAAIIGVLLIVGVSGARVARMDIGHVGVVRNGGPFDNRAIRQVIKPGSALTWIGWFSQTAHEYPASHVTRLYTVTSDPKRGARDGSDVISLPTKDGVQVGIEAAVYYRFVGEKHEQTLKRFDSSVGTRRFRTPSGELLYPWQNDDGWNAMVDSLFRPMLENELRKQIGSFRCAELVTSCALVRGPAATGVRSPSANLPRIQERIDTSLERDLTATLSQPYFWDIRFRLARVTLPGNVQAAVDDAQAKFASVNSARAEARQARYINARNKLLSETYNSSPALANIEQIKALPRSATVILSTGGGNGNGPSILAQPGGGGGAAAGGGGGGGG